MPNSPAAGQHDRAGEPRPEGNAVYKIDRDGFVTEIFRQPVLVLAMVEHNGTLLIATGSEGEIYQVNPAADETIVLAKADPKQVTCLLPASDGNIYMGMANVGSIATMSSGFATKGTYTSAVLDATQISRFGKMHLHGSFPPGTSLTHRHAQRECEGAGPKKDGRIGRMRRPPRSICRSNLLSARFLQYRLTFESKDGTASPVVDDVAVAYQMPNLPPQVKSVRIVGNPDTGNGGQAQSASAVAIGPSTDSTDAQADDHLGSTDPNGDALLTRSISGDFRPGPGFCSRTSSPNRQFEWDTRSLPMDGTR